MNTDYAETQAYGVTQHSTKFVEQYLKKVGSIVQIECLLAGNTHLEFGKEQWVAFVDENNDRIVVSGFSWGYGGEGPHGLFKMAQELGFNLDMELIANYPPGEYWTVYRERMELTEELAGYIISLQEIADMERGLGDDELIIRHKLELEFPKLKWERERQEFNNWLWSTRAEQEPDVVEARSLLGHDIPHDKIYYADCREPGMHNPNAPEGTYALYREHTEVAGQLFRDTKDTAENRLLDQDDRGEINLKNEWQEWQTMNSKIKAETA